MLLCAILLTCFGLSLGQHCNIHCTKEIEPVAKAGDCICSPGFPSRYSKGGYLCSVRLWVNEYRRVRLKTTHFKLRGGGKHCTLDYLRFYNRFNPNKEYPMDRVCNRRHFHKSGDIIINSAIVRLAFRVDPKSQRSVSGKKWRVCLRKPHNPNNFKVNSCPFTMSGMKKGFNRRRVEFSMGQGSVLKFCCAATSLSKVDYVNMICKESGTPNVNITENGQPTCVYCSQQETQAVLEADIVYPNSNKNIQCNCTELPEVAIGQPCSGIQGCIDSLNRATCVDQVCTCPTGTVPSTDNTHCTYDSPYNNYCEDVLDCTEPRAKQCNTVTNKCVCQTPTFTRYRGICSYKSLYNGYCVYNEDCAVSNSKCSANKCVCVNANYKKKTSSVCAPVCSQRGTAGKHFGGTVVCNRRKKQTCFKCKCISPPGWLTYMGKKNSFCKAGFNCQKTTISYSSYKCG